MVRKWDLRSFAALVAATLAAVACGRESPGSAPDAAADSATSDATDGPTSSDASSTGPETAAITCPTVTLEIQAPGTTAWQLSNGGDYGYALTILDGAGSLAPAYANAHACAPYSGPPLPPPSSPDPSSSSCVDCSTCQDFDWCAGMPCPVGPSFLPLDVTVPMTWDGRYFGSSSCGSPATSCATPVCAPPGRYGAQLCALPALPGYCPQEPPFACVTAMFDYPPTGPAILKLPVTTYPVGGTLSGLPDGGMVTVADDGCIMIPLVSNGPFVFPALLSGTQYDVQIWATSPSVTCSVDGGAGTVGMGPVNNVAVSCATQ
jgi:hypothetical protein